MVFGDELVTLTEEYCLNPDKYYAVEESSQPPVVYVQGRQFHYLPPEPVQYDWVVVNVDGKTELAPEPPRENLHHTHCRDGFCQYFTRIPSALRAGRIHEAAQLTGSLLHMLQDGTVPPHAFEGPDGCDFFVLNRLLSPPPEQPYLTPTAVLGRVPPVAPESIDRAPRLLGVTPQEASFHLYSDFCNTVLANRRRALPLAQAMYSGDTNAVTSISRALNRDTVVLCVDVLYSLFAMARQQITAADATLLMKADLAAIRPARRPHSLSGPYRNLGVVRNFSLNQQLEPIPLALTFVNGKKRVFEKGLGMGAHLYFAQEYQLPCGLYRRLSGHAGLHSDLGQEGHVSLQWLLNEKTIWEANFKGADSAQSFDLDVSEGGWLRLQGRSLTPDFDAPENQIVIAEPILERVALPARITVIQQERDESSAV